ncbi:MAG TPA: PEP-CTERM sorting domain-containing protein [Gemmatales bacterium]|nr:PEP-CTERM sorting domain-containing protein [Gemmatales bacterium]HMP16124.1 PEP-CTERM sorting domain-containing protein [Gemmatales bacterium]
MRSLFRSFMLAIAACSLLAPASWAQTGVLLNENFDAYANGNLEGQFGWTQILASSTAPLQVQNGRVIFPANPSTGTGGPVVDNQDVAKTFTTFDSPGSLFTGMNITVDASFPVASYFFAMTDTPTGFANFRLTARESPSFPGQFEFGVRVTGQAGYPFDWGAPLNYGQDYRVILQAEMNAGAQNDRVLLYIDPVDSILGNQTPYAVGEYSSGAGTDPTALGLVIFSQFYNAGTGQSGVSISNITVADNFAAAVPEPSTYALIGLTLAGVGFTQWRRRRAMAKAS